MGDFGGIFAGMWGQPPKFKFFAVLFRFRAEFTERSIFRAVGGIRCGNFAVGKDERVKFKFFAIPIKFYFGCSRGGETISNAEVFSPASSTSLARAALSEITTLFYESFCPAFFKKRESFRPVFFEKRKSSRLRTN